MFSYVLKCLEETNETIQSLGYSCFNSKHTCDMYSLFVPWQLVD